jgi:hypothetical protein
MSHEGAEGNGRLLISLKRPPRSSLRPGRVLDQLVASLAFQLMHGN